MADRQLPIATICKMTALSRHTVYRLIHSGELGATKNPGPTGSFRVSETDLENYLQRNRFRPTGTAHRATA